MSFLIRSVLFVVILGLVLAWLATGIENQILRRDNKMLLCENSILRDPYAHTPVNCMKR